MSREAPVRREAGLRRIASGSFFETLAAYSRAVVDDLYVHVSGTVGTDPVTGRMPADVVEQARNSIWTIREVLAQAGAGIDDIVRCRIFLVDAADLESVAAVLRETFADCPPANTTLINMIPAPGARIEIEVTARRPAAATE